MSDDVYVLFKPVHVFSKVALLAPMTATDTKKLKRFFTRSKLLLILGIVFAILTYLALQDVTTVHPINDNILLSMDRASLGYSLVLVLVILKTSTQYGNLVPKVLWKLKDFDGAVSSFFGEEIDSRMRCKKYIARYLVHMLISNTFLSCEIIYALWSFGNIQWYTVANYISLTLREVLTFQYVTVLNFTYWRYLKLNDLITNLDVSRRKKDESKLRGLILVSLGRDVEESKLDQFDQVKVIRLKEHMTMLRIMHECLTGICSDASETYGLFHAMAVVATLLEGLLHFYAIFTLVSHDANVTYAFLYLSILRSIMYMLVITFTHHVFVFYFCDAVGKESIKAGNLIQQLFLKTDFKDQLVEDVRLFSLQLKQSELDFSAAGLFVLGWELMSEVVGEVSSYLIFFIQSSGFTFNQAILDKNGNQNITRTSN